jgi:ABC-type branched-subunit amino acid transport system ATPase component
VTTTSTTDQSETGHNADPVLDVAGVAFSYGKVQVLFGVDLQVRPHETVALAGTNGAGKSTLLRVISGLERLSAGSVQLDGNDVTRLSAEARVPAGIVQVVGGKATFGPLSVEENLRMAAYLYPRREVDAKIEQALTRFPILADRRRTLASELSGGQRQMLALAMGLLHEPRVLLIDELSLGLAPVVLQSVLEIVEGLKEAGQAMLIVEQTLAAIQSIADRAVFIEKGEVRFTGDVEHLLEEGTARAVFFGVGS